MDAPIYCNKCGSPNAPMGVYCSRCGTPLNPAMASAPGSAAAPAVAAAMPYAPVVAAGARYGGFWIRVVAVIIDEIVVHVATTPIAILFGLGGLGLLGAHRGFSPEDFGHLDLDMLRLYIIGGFSLVLLRVAGRWLYEALMTSSSYQATLGKMIFGMKVTDLYGNRISFARATGRYFAKILSGMMLGIGFLMVGFTERKQGLHDMIAETLVKRT
jgi:uncharacterized RDD family membrane protein YckC